MKERLESYIKDLYWDLNKDEERYVELMERIDNAEDEQEKRYYLSELANVSGRKDTTKDIIECLEDIVKYSTE